MYKIKPNGNYNLLIADLKLTLLPESENVTLTDEEFENSVDIKNLLNYLVIEKVDSNYTKVEKTELIKKNKVKNNNQTVFVVCKEQTPVNEGVFVKNVELEMANIENVEIIADDNINKTIPAKVEEKEVLETNEVINSDSSKVESVEVNTEKTKAPKKTKTTKEKSEKAKTEKTKTENTKTKKINSKKNENTVQ